MATQLVIQKGWCDTGDLAYCVKGEVFITGRKKISLLKAGRNISPEAVEEVVNQVAGIRKGCVIAFGIADPNSGTEKLIVVAEIYATVKHIRKEIHAHIIENMAIALDVLPDNILLVPPGTIPKTSSGKLRRSTCKQSYRQGKLTSFKLSPALQWIKLSLMRMGNSIVKLSAALGKVIYSVYIGIILLLNLPIIWIGVLVLPKTMAAKLIRLWAEGFSEWPFVLLR